MDKVELENQIEQLLWEKSLLEDKFVSAVDENGRDCSFELITEMEFEIQDIEEEILKFE